MHTGGVQIEWDPAKAESNKRKHGVEFPDAALALEDELALTVLDPGSDYEDRYITLGVDPQGVLLVVVFTIRGERIRLISARQATSRERREYEEQR
jgi:uncharacterized protein